MFVKDSQMIRSLCTGGFVEATLDARKNAELHIFSAIASRDGEFDYSEVIIESGMLRNLFNMMFGMLTPSVKEMVCREQLSLLENDKQA